MDNQLLQRITLDPNICHGKPCIRGLRYPVELILELLSSGMNAKEIIDDYDDLEHEDILAALLFAARLTQVKSIYRVLV
ncbi:MULTISPECIES: DUF433 domain-containing protein [unclassified Microcoleus]|jgi:uncharacterized protein (DUF433 family)|uniref:DUF433 domain-containing protein n=1 Tax=unclassified Microcoleus TaxID=2642155 RepID=UPI001DCE2B8D|nr:MULTISPECIES: DUF433 domain-containing protein [unclassified Microcoleus]MCC3431283.1 DUF433 domain-containing protein [Microcoleus sp. PH2017_04_SCI_O_A]MCC3443685.1 DUF433 domain-containing protein [Microcoleus sp. PH2017_03_ELD_O_A]MCC3506426.1 DUF433 domain-containing protein [Microcoleus sp. PH2017_19_SFW_U_A]TAF85976.1 MAG: DUF433 domain-containing protein [Oscillatoriales cyanobacterium]MCC3412729.1 DUF433 domain-containing protein [Microcoleus sp. PH2017_02_FOX_O_A]